MYICVKKKQTKKHLQVRRETHRISLERKEEKNILI